MRQYELTYLVSDNVSESELTKVTGKVGGLITDLKGKVLKEESWGRRKLVYSINKNNFATYVTVFFEIDPDNILTFKKDLQHIDNVIRHLLIVKDYGKKEITLAKGEVVEGEEIAKVIGGEKSKEAISEEDIDNRDLMAKREEKETIQPDADKKEADLKPVKKPRPSAKKTDI